MIDEAEVVRALRKQHGLTLRAMGERTGICYTSINNIELGRHKVTLYLFQRILDGFDLELAIVRKGTIK